MKRRRIEYLVIEGVMHQRCNGCEFFLKSCRELFDCNRVGRFYSMCKTCKKLRRIARAEAGLVGHRGKKTGQLHHRNLIGLPDVEHLYDRGQTRKTGT